MEDMRRTMLPLFATPLSNQRWADAQALNDALTQAILAEQKQAPGVDRSNVGGWHSDTGFLDRTLPAVAELRDRIRAHVTALCRATAVSPDNPVSTRFRLEGWANVLRYGEYHSLHCHPNAFWSGVYYVNGNPQAEAAHAFSGRLELVDPRPGASLTYADQTNLYGRFLIDPSAGQIVVFPGWLQHHVHPYFGPGVRIAVAFNATFG